MKPKSILPVWIKTYRKDDFRPDLMAGLTVGIMLIPQAMAYAMLAGLPPIYGLYASFLPPVMYGLFGTARMLSVGPAAIVSLLTVSGIGLIAHPGSEEYLVLVALLSLTVGIIQFSLGVIRLGFLVHFLSSPVILGFTLAAVILIGLSQLKHLLGIPLPALQYLHEIVPAILQAIPATHALTLCIGIAAVLILFLFQKYATRFPAPLAVVMVSIFCTWVFRLDHLGVSIVGEIEGRFPRPYLPVMDVGNIMAILSTAFAVAVISFMESTAIARALQSRKKGLDVNPDKELMSLGLANMMSALFRTMPVTGGLSRSLVNAQSGARSGMSTLVSSGLILLTVLFFSPLFYYLPLATLAAIIIMAIAKLVQPTTIQKLWAVDRKDFWMMLTTFFCTLFFGIPIGIGVGILLSLAWIIYEASYPHHAELGRVPGTTTYRNVRRFYHLEMRPGVMVFRFDAPLFFANADRFRDVVHEYLQERKEPIHAVIADMESVNSMDSTAIQMLFDLHDELKLRGIQLYLVEVKGPVRDKLHISGFTEKLGAQFCCVTVEDAMQIITGNDRDTDPGIALQTNITHG
jgi:SulP family sulfate permease